MANEWERNFYDINKALTRSYDGQSGRYIYARARNNLREFRITRYKNHRGLHYGYELSTGKWIVIADWQER